jgi:DNA mismatch repair protein MutS
MPNSTRCGRCATSRAASSPACSCYAEETGVKSLKIKHNNVLGYFIEVTAGNAIGVMTDARRGQGPLHPPPDHGGRHALHHDRAGRSRKQDRQCRRPGAGDRARRLRRAGRAAVVAEARRSRRRPRALAVLDVSAGARGAGRRQAYCRPHVDGSADAFAIVGGRHPVVEQALRRQAAQNPFVANDCDLSPTTAGRTARSGCSPARTWAANRPSCARTR